MGKLKVVLIGCGSISGAWISPSLKEPDIKFVGLVDIKKENAINKAEEFNLTDVVIGTDLKEVLKETKPDIVFNCTIPASHYETTITAMESGCHVLVEKPMADNMDDAKRMIDVSLKTGKTLAVLQNYRFKNYIEGVREFIFSKKIGDLTTINSDFYIGAHFEGFRKYMPHVLIADMAIHTFDMARYISDADPISVYCKEWNPEGSWAERDISALAVFEMTKGIIYSYRGSWCSEGFSTTWDADWRIIGDEGTILWNGNEKFLAEKVAEETGFVRKTEPVKIDFPPKYPESEGHAGVIKNFIHSIITDEKPLTTCQDNIKSLSMVLSAIESSKKKKEIKINI